MDALTFDMDEIPSSPANWTAHVYALGRRYLLWLRHRASQSATPTRTAPRQTCLAGPRHASRAELV